MFSIARWLGGANGAEQAGAAELPRAAGADPAGDRRIRDVPTAEDQVRGAIAQKILHGWLQNRHQTLMPLSVNLARLAADAQVAVARFAALAAAAARDPAATARLGEWLASAGADEPTMAAFREAIAQPPTLPDGFEAVARPDLAPLAFVAALVAARGGTRPSRLFADYAAAVLALPSGAVRSAERRYRV